MRYFSALSILIFGLTVHASDADDQVNEIDRTMALIQTWFGGVYDNSAQVAADKAKNLPAEKIHMPIHQVVQPVSLEGFDGITYYQQLTNDGTTDTLLGVGIYQFRADPGTASVKLRFHMFNDAGQFVDAHLEPGKLNGVTLDDVHSSEGCAFYFSTSEDGSQVKGVMGEPGCYPISRSTGKKIHHIDELIIKSDKFLNNARYYDLDGKLLFGNATGEYAIQVRIKE
jgi:hypothetical protein